MELEQLLDALLLLFACLSIYSIFALVSIPVFSWIARTKKKLTNADRAALLIPWLFWISMTFWVQREKSMSNLLVEMALCGICGGFFPILVSVGEKWHWNLWLRTIVGLVVVCLCACLVYFSVPPLSE